jgi:tRNA G26 N,N-dimethylase Trm1
MIEIFKTNIQEDTNINSITQKLLKHFPASKIDFDLEDCDKILRIESDFFQTNKVIEELNKYGFECEVLI